MLEETRASRPEDPAAQLANAWPQQLSDRFAAPLVGSLSQGNINPWRPLTSARARATAQQSGRARSSFRDGQVMRPSTSGIPRCGGVLASRTRRVVFRLICDNQKSYGQSLARRGRERLGRPRRRRTRHERRPADLPQIRLRDRSLSEHRSARSTANLGISRPPAPGGAITPRPTHIGGCNPAFLAPIRAPRMRPSARRSPRHGLSTRPPRAYRTRFAILPGRQTASKHLKSASLNPAHSNLDKPEKPHE